MVLDIVANVKRNVEISIKRLGDNGIKLLNLVIPKPDIPRDIAANYKAVKVQWTEQLVAVQQQKTEKIKKETESIKALLDAEREKDVLEIELQKQLLKKEREKEVNDLEIQIIKSREENQANVDAQDHDNDIGDKIIMAFSLSIKPNPHTKKLKEEQLDSHMSLNLSPEQSEERVIMLGFCLSLILLGVCSILTSMGIYQRLQKEDQKFTIQNKHTESKTYTILVIIFT